MRFLPQIPGIEAQVGIRMKNFGPGKPLFSKTSQVLPRHPAFLTATLQHPQPAFAHFTPKALEIVLKLSTARGAAGTEARMCGLRGPQRRRTIRSRPDVPIDQLAEDLGPGHGSAALLCPKLGD